jgi:signal transduction histidine kinase
VTTTRTLRVLIVEDSVDDAELVARELQRGGFAVLAERVETRGTMAAALDQQRWDLVISDFALPNFDALQAFALVQERGLDLPFIIVSGAIGEETAVEAMRAGVHDYFVKGRLARLTPAVERELRDAAVRAERTHMQEQLVLSDRMASLGLLAAGVAHEINNPLAVLMGHLELVQRALARTCERPQPDCAAPGVAEPLRSAREAAERVKQIVSDLKLFSRADELHRGPVDIVQVLDSAVRMANNEIRHRARLISDVQPVPPVSANQFRLGQVFLNLLINAAQAIPEGHSDQNEIRLRTWSAGDRVLVEVSDTGVGIPREVLPRVFEPFFTTKPFETGTGLGLSICHRIVTEHGGEITVDSRPGRGTTFRVSLPAQREEQAPAPAPEAAPAPTPAPARRRARILFVDDEPMLCDLVTQVLRSRHDVAAVTSAREALTRLGRGERFDVILCDLMMPVMTGMELYDELSRVAPEQRERVIFLTGGAFTSNARSFLSKVPNPRLEKPFDLDDLLTLVAAHMGN